MIVDGWQMGDESVPVTAIVPRWKRPLIVKVVVKVCSVWESSGVSVTGPENKKLPLWLIANGCGMWIVTSSFAGRPPLGVEPV